MSCTQIEVQEVQEVQWVQEVQGVRIRPIRLIRGKTEEPILWRTALQAAFVVRHESEGVAPGYSK